MMIVRLLIYLFESPFRNYWLIDFYMIFLLMHVSSKAYWTLIPKNLEFVHDRLCCGRWKFFFLSWWKWKLVVEFKKKKKKQTWISILFFLRWQTPLQIRMASLGKYVFVPRGKSNASFMAIFACFVLFLYVMTLSLWLHILDERYAACARNMNMRRTENDRFTFAGKLM